MRSDSPAAAPDLPLAASVVAGLAVVAFAALVPAAGGVASPLGGTVRLALAILAGSGAALIAWSALFVTGGAQSPAPMPAPVPGPSPRRPAPASDMRVE